MILQMKTMKHQRTQNLNHIEKNKGDHTKRLLNLLKKSVYRFRFKRHCLILKGKVDGQSDGTIH